MTDQGRPVVPLIHTGAAKAASTWMQTQIFRNAGLGFEELASRKEQRSLLLRPSSTEFDPSAAQEFFYPLSRQIVTRKMCPVVSVEGLSGQSRLGDQNALELADRLHAVFPDGKILYIVREQGSMLRAQYLQYIRRGGHRSIKWFLEQDGQDGVAAAYFRWDRFKYDALVRHYHILFGADRVLVLPLEMLASAPRLFLDRLLKFCGQPHEEMKGCFAFAAKRESASSLSYALSRWLNLWFAERGDLSQQSVWPFSIEEAKLRAARRRADQVLPTSWKIRYQAGIDRLIAETLGGFYADSNASLERATGLDLAPFGYTLDA